MKIWGSGILGLGVAEWFSRHGCGPKITVIEKDSLYGGSAPAAALLHTKAQVVGRDPHFSLKLQAKSIYAQWILNLRNEYANSLNTSTVPVLPEQQHFLEPFLYEGASIDIHLNTAAADAQWLRVRQADVEQPSLLRLTPQSICYLNEPWVDARVLLPLLKQVLVFRGVTFKGCDSPLSQAEWQDQHVICGGVFSEDILRKMGVSAEWIPGIKKKRLTLGSTFAAEIDIEDILKQDPLLPAALHQCGDVTHIEVHSVTGETFVLSLYQSLQRTLEMQKRNISSAQKPLQTLVSSSVFRTDLSLGDGAQSQLLAYETQWLGALKQLLPSLNVLQRRSGARIGYGHQELVIAKIAHTKDCCGPLFFCSGAHKSGFLYAPVVGAELSRQGCSTETP